MKIMTEAVVADEKVLDATQKIFVSVCEHGVEEVSLHTSACIPPYDNCRICYCCGNCRCAGRQTDLCRLCVVLAADTSVALRSSQF
jgi:hypothetical protein